MEKKVWVKLMALLVAIVLIVVLIIQNTGTHQFHILFWKLRISQALLLLITFLTGFGAGILTILHISARHKKRKK
ncbi:MAG: lipopolysaccharide assembly protein LapA domain-containing protein [Candidatus Brocadiia bacterium]